MSRDGSAFLQITLHTYNVIRHNEHHHHSTLCGIQFLRKRRTGMLAFIWLVFKVWFVWASPGFVHSYVSSKKVVTFPLVPVQQGLCDCIAVRLLSEISWGTQRATSLWSPRISSRMWGTVLWHTQTSTANSCAVQRRSASNREARSRFTE